MSKDEDFYQRIYIVVKQIPYGKVSSYGAIASYLGMPSSARIVGWALSNSHQYGDIPAHRVLNRNGVLTGKHHFISPNLMQQLLEQEGHIIKDDVLQGFKSVFWNPQCLR